MIVDNAAGEDPDFGEFLMNSIIVHPDYARRNPETVRKVPGALVRANRWVAANPAADFMIEIGALAAPIPYEAVVTHDVLPR